VTVAAVYSKRRRQDTLPLRPGLASELKTHLANKPPAASAFNVPYKETLSNAYKSDIKAAEIAYRDDEDLVADFHSLRHTFITNLARSGVHPKAA